MQGFQEYSPSEISLHSSKKDCWLVIHGKVYDVTTFLEDHPGGDDVLIQASATGDATQSFEEVGHSSTAASMMEGYLIGVVEGSESSGGGEQGLKAKESGAPKARATQGRKEQQPSYSLFDYLLPLIILCVAIGSWYFLNYHNTEA